MGDFSLKYMYDYVKNLYSPIEAQMMTNATIQVNSKELITFHYTDYEYERDLADQYAAQLYKDAFQSGSDDYVDIVLYPAHRKARANSDDTRAADDYDKGASRVLGHVKESLALGQLDPPYRRLNIDTNAAVGVQRDVRSIIERHGVDMTDLRRVKTFETLFVYIPPYEQCHCKEHAGSKRP